MDLHPQSTALALRCVADCLFGGLIIKEEKEGFVSCVALASYPAMEVFVQFISDLGEACELEVATTSIVVKVGAEGKTTSVEGTKFMFRQTYEGETDVIMEMDVGKDEEVDRWLSTFQPKGLEVKNGLMIDKEEGPPEADLEEESESDSEDWWL